MKRSRLPILVVLLLVPWHAFAFGLWASQSPAPLAEYLDRPFDNASVCLYSSDLALNARDIHLIGAPKQVVQQFTAYDDNGAVSLDTRTIMHFSRNGDFLDSTASDKDSVFSSTLFKYDASGRLDEISADLPKGGERCSAKFSRDKSGRLAGVSVSSSSGGERTISVSYESDGRLKESLERRLSGQADWRLAYSYTEDATKIERYFADKDGEQHETSTFQFDGKKRILRVAAQSSYPDFEEIGDFGFRYQNGGIAVVHADTARDGKRCVYDFSVHHDGETDERSFHVWGDPSLWCHGPIEGGDQYQTFFDRRGNKVVDRQSEEVLELGRTVLRPKFVILNAISYW
jgi:hypothetical protein